MMVSVFVRMRLAVPLRRRGLRHEAYLAMLNAALGNDRVRERPHLMRIAAQHRDFKTVL